MLDITMIACINHQSLDINLLNNSIELEDRFKRLIDGNITVMEQSVYEAFINHYGKPFSNCVNVVITEDDSFKENVEHDVITYNNIESVINQCTMDSADDSKRVIILGGKNLYDAFLPYVAKIEFMLLDELSDINNYFSREDMEPFHVVNRILFNNSESSAHQYLTYKRTKKGLPN